MSNTASEHGGDYLECLAEWQQGDFAIDCGDFVFRDLAAPGSEDGDDGGAVLDSEVVGFAVISQTCDVVRAPVIVPYVSVCPLVTVDKRRIGDIESGRAPRFGLLSSTPEDVVVDFSRIMSISKPLLVLWTRQRGCTDERRQLEFARSLESFFGRFAFPDEFVESLGSLRNAIFRKYPRGDSDFGRALRSIRDLRVLPHASGTDRESIPITFLAILEDRARRELKERGAIEKLIRPKIESIRWKPPFSLHRDGLYVATLADITAADL